MVSDGDRYFMSQRIRTLKPIRAKIRPEPPKASHPLESWCESHCLRLRDNMHRRQQPQRGDDARGVEPVGKRA